MILAGRVDAAAIDSTVLEEECRREPGMENRIRVVETLGPSPIPPWVVRRGLTRELREEVRAVLLDMEHDAEGRAVLAAGHLARFVWVEDRDYGPIRRMARLAERVRL